MAGEANHVQAEGTIDQSVRRFVRQATWALALRRAVMWSAGWLVAWGVLVLVLRVTGDVSLRWLLAGGLGLPMVLMLAGWRAWRARPEAATVRAMLDSRLQCGGLLMVQDETGIDAWRARLPGQAAMRVRWRGGRSLAAMGVAGAFVVAAFVVPEHVTQIARAQPLDVSGPTGRLAEQLEVLAEEALIEPEDASSLAERLDRLAAEASGDDPVRTWEALDHLRERLEQAAAEAGEAAVQETAALTAAQVLAEALAEDGDLLSAEQQAEAMQALADMTARAMAERGALSDQLGASLAEAINSGSLSEEQLAALAEALRDRKMDIAEMMDRLAECDLADERMLTACRLAGEGESGGMCEMLAGLDGEMSIEDAVAMWCQGGGWGISQNGGLTPMTWHDQPGTEEGAGFEAMALPTADASALRDSLLVGLSATAPEVDELAEASVGGALRDAPADGGAAATQRLLPRHRETAQRYFDRDESR
ncbi:hypothetical protein ACERK3_09830 [Phycisphaerales bacterium AB-hyl4]|uniref:Uncharacterized protein n=1 Tax=Natronomicrosphaera hydrolytica TaxID=3242702 RepID=A0ABV4U4R5_9BACT